MPRPIAAMAPNRMRTRQSYRTVSRLQRRRTWAQERMGMRQDFTPAGEEPPEAAAPATPEEPSYIAELEHLAQLRDQEVIRGEESEAHTKQLLGI